MDHGTAASGEADGVDAEDAAEELTEGMPSIESGSGRGAYSYECDLSPTVMASRLIDL
jgi:hypothetical protein